MTRICFCNPFGTDQFDDLVLETLTPYLREGTTVESVHIEDCPRNIDYYLPKHLVETELFKLILRAEEDGFDAFVIGCCYDPGLTVAREITSMPVVGPLEASIAASAIGALPTGDPSWLANDSNRSPSAIHSPSIRCAHWITPHSPRSRWRSRRPGRRRPDPSPRPP
ncbi:MAG: aspartate/glutamate racemase family protein [Actinomycetota bacterium]